MNFQNQGSEARGARRAFPLRSVKTDDLHHELVSGFVLARLLLSVVEHRPSGIFRELEQSPAVMLVRFQSIELGRRHPDAATPLTCVYDTEPPSERRVLSALRKRMWYPTPCDGMP